jgi:hypothetical protein
VAQHDYNIANQSGAAFRADLNNALSAIVSQNSGAAEPSTTYAYMPWADTTNGLFKIRNAANSAWITLYQLDGEWSAIPLEDGSATAPPLYFKDSGTDTGIFSPGADQFGIATAGVERVEYGTSEVVFNDGGANYDFRVEGDTNPNLFKIDAGLDQVQVANLNGGPLAGSRNRIINGGMVIDQRSNGGSLSSGVNAITYSVDRWYVYALGAAVIAQRVVSSASSFQSALRILGAASNTAAVIGQRIEAANSFDLANQVVSLSFVAASSASISLTWNILYADATDDFTNKTLANTGTQATTPAMTRYFATFTLPANATTGLAVEFTAANLTSGSIDITGVQLEPGSVATPFERRSYGQELALCQRYFAVSTAYGWGYAAAGGANRVASAYLPVTMRVAPSVVFTAATGGNVTGQTAVAISANNFGVDTTVGTAGAYSINLNFTASAEL